MIPDIEIYDEIWHDKTLHEALRDQQAIAMTGYNFKDLQQAIADGEDMLDEDEIKEVEKSVNVLAHMFKYFEYKGKIK